MSKKVKLSKEERRAAAIKTGVQLARKVGAGAVTVAAVAAKHQVTPPVIFHIFGSQLAFAKAIAKEAKKQGVELPYAKLIVRTPRPKKVAALLKPKVAVGKKTNESRAKLLKASAKAAPRKRSVAEVKAIKDKIAGKRALKVTAKKGEDLRKLSATELVERATPVKRKALTPEQKEAKAKRDKARRAPALAALPGTPLAKFAALPDPMTASIAAVTAA